MELTVREAAALLGKHPRTIRAKIARGDLHAFKREGQWRIPRGTLPLTEPQRQDLQVKAEAVRTAVEAHLPGRTAESRGDRRRSVADLDVFRGGLELLAWVRDAEDLSARTLAGVEAALEVALMALSEGVHHYARHEKRAAFVHARAAFARAAALLLEAGVPPTEPVHTWLVALEGRLIPATARLVRWSETLPGRRQ